MSLSLNQLFEKAGCSGIEYQLSEEERSKLEELKDVFDKYSYLFKPFLSQESDFEFLIFDVETDVDERDKIGLVGVLHIPRWKIYHFEGRLSRSDLEGLLTGSPVVVFVAFNAPFDLMRAFDESCEEILHKRTPWFAGEQVVYKIYKREGVLSYALDILRIARNVLDTKKGGSLKALSEDNKYFKKLETQDFLDKEYNAYDLLAELEVLLRCVERIEKFIREIEIRDVDIIDLILSRYRFETVESHISWLKLFESGSRLAKALVAPFNRFPSMPAFFAGGRVWAYRVGEFREAAYFDINSMYPAIISRMSPGSMELIEGEQAREMVVRISRAIQDLDHSWAFNRFYVDQAEPALLLSSEIVVFFLQDATWRVEALKERKGKASKSSPYTMVYRSKRGDQSRAEGYVKFKSGDYVQIPLYFLFLQSKTQLRRIQICEAAGYKIDRDLDWQAKWERLYNLRKANPEVSESLKVALNSTYGLMADVDQAFANLSFGAHITAFARTISYMVEREVGEGLIYTDTDSYIVENKAREALAYALDLVAPFGYKEEFTGNEKLVVFKTKRYAILRADGSWVVKGAEKLGGREKNKLRSYLEGVDREVVGEIKQVTKKLATPNIPGVKKLLGNSLPGEWCYYFEYPLSLLKPYVKVSLRRYNQYISIREIGEALDAGESGEVFEEVKITKVIKQLALRVGFKEKHRGKRDSNWWLHLFEFLRAYGYSTKDDLMDILGFRELDVQLTWADAEEKTLAEYGIEWDNPPRGIVFDLTKNKMVYYAAKNREALEQWAGTLPSIPKYKASFEKSISDSDIPLDIFTPFYAHLDTSHLQAQVSLASLMHLPVDNREKMRLMSKAIARLGESDNRGVKLEVEYAEMVKGAEDDWDAVETQYKGRAVWRRLVIKEEPVLKSMPRRARKKKPLPQRRFYVQQRFPYYVKYHVNTDAFVWENFPTYRQKFIFKHVEHWIPATLVKLHCTYLSDLKLLEDRFNQAFNEVVKESNNFILKMRKNSIPLKLLPYARYTRFDIAFDIETSNPREIIDDFENVLRDEENIDYHKGNGYIGVRGKQISNSKTFVPANIVLYERGKRFELRREYFYRAFKPFVEEYEPIVKGYSSFRVEIQTFAHKSNNRKTNPYASILNALELVKLRIPHAFKFLQKFVPLDDLSVLTHMCSDPPLEGSGSTGEKLSSLPCNAQNYSKVMENARTYLSMFGVGPPKITA